MSQTVPTEPVEWRDVPPVKLASWDIAEHRYVDRSGNDKTEPVLRVLGDNDAVGYYRGGADEGELREGAALLEGRDLLDHDGMYALFLQNRLPSGPARAWDIACWDLHARMLEVPLWHFWKKKRDRVMLYGDVRWDWFQDVKEFADCVGHRVHEEGMHAVKLHLPGTWGLRHPAGTWGDPDAGVDPPGLDTTLACLKAAREAAGDDAILAYDPFNPECFHFEEDLQVVDTLQECGYEWHEGGIPEFPEEKWLPRYVELCEHADLRIEPEGGWEPAYEPTEEEKADRRLHAVDRDLRWAEAGAADQFHYDMHESGRGITAGLRLIETFRSRPDLDVRLNFHWHWQPHQHLAFGVEAGLWPYLECSTQRKVPGRTENGYLLPPDWVGVYDLDAEHVGTPRN